LQGPRVARRRSMAWYEARDFYISISPWIIGFLLFTGGPVIASFVLSFYRFDAFNPPSFLGLDNYVQLLFRDQIFFQSLRVTAVYALFAVPLGIAGGLALAMMLNQRIPGLSIWRTIFYLPSVISGVALAMLWGWIFNPEFGLVNYALWLLFRIKGPGWIFVEEWALPSFIIMSLWGVGGGMVLYLAGLQGVPTELYEAASLDGAGALGRFRFVTLPIISPVLFFTLITGIIGSFQVFTQAYVLTQGGPNYATFFYVLLLFEYAFQNFWFGLAAAQAWILFLIILVLSLITFRSSSLWVHYEGGDQR
jgi:multiple sugar transport system permease protein